MYGYAMSAHGSGQNGCRRAQGVSMQIMYWSCNGARRSCHACDATAQYGGAAGSMGQQRWVYGLTMYGLWCHVGVRWVCGCQVRQVRRCPVGPGLWPGLARRRPCNGMSAYELHAAWRLAAGAAQRTAAAQGAGVTAGACMGAGVMSVRECDDDVGLRRVRHVGGMAVGARRRTVDCMRECRWCNGVAMVHVMGDGCGCARRVSAGRVTGAGMGAYGRVMGDGYGGGCGCGQGQGRCMTANDSNVNDVCRCRRAFAGYGCRVDVGGCDGGGR